MTDTATAAPPRTIELIEQGQASRHPDRLCEDAMTVTPQYAAVLDGVASLRPSIQGSLLSPGISAVKAVISALGHAPPPPDASAGDLVRHMHAAVRTVDSLASDAGDRTPPACAVAVLDPAAGRVVRVGDIHVLVDGFPHPP